MSLRTFSIALFFLSFLPRPGQADAWLGDRNAAVRLIVATQATGSAAAIEGGLEFRFAPGWHGYWRNPGEAGFAPSMDWEGSENLAGVEVSWPAPKRTNLLGIDTIAYEESVILPLHLTLAQPGRPLSLRLKLDYLACAELCVPYRADLALTLPAGMAQPSDEALAIAAAQARVPGSAAMAGLVPKSVQIVQDKGQWWLNALLEATPTLQAPDLFLHGLEGVTLGPPLIARQGQTVRLKSRLNGLSEAGSLAYSLVSLTVVDGRRAAEFTALAQISPQMSSSSGQEDEPSLLLIAALAMLGGLILNVMPCVLPVLALKLLALTNHLDASVRQQRLSLAMTALGIVASFVILALAALGLRAGGIAIGWGMQFQHSGFLIFMICLLSLFAANLFGWLTIASLGPLAHLGAARARHPALDALLSGLFVTLLATPCTAPFVGTAIGFALSRGPTEILILFCAMGVGFAAPYLILAALPGLGFLVPKPGRWTIYVRTLLGVALLGATLWLIGILASSQGIPAGLTALALVVTALTALGASARMRQGVKRSAGFLALALLGLTFWLPSGLIFEKETASSASQAQNFDKNWRRFSQAALLDALAQGKTVLVDVTANWCLNCKFNKLMVLDRPYLVDLLSSGQVLGLRADWTKPDAQIAAYLASFGRYGIPFNVLYSFERPDGVVLGENLSETELRTALRTARGEKGK